VSPSHLVAKFSDAAWTPAAGPLAAATGYTGWVAVGPDSPAVHTGFGLGRLDPGGRIPWHLHSYEESLYVMDGEAVVQTPDGAALLTAGDYGLIPLGVPHMLRNEGTARAQWARCSAPAPRAAHHGDTEAVPGRDDVPARRIDVKDPRTRRYGHVAPEHMDPTKQGQQNLAVSASMRTALLVYSGITLKMMVDTDLGSVLANMFMVQYEPGGLASPHDHPLEEAYLILQGSVQATFDGTEYQLEPGDIAWAGVGCVHSFRNIADVPVKWLETQSPLPPARHAYRFMRDWDHLREGLQAEREGQPTS
jgi:quercetin dioxygenase-like cupin family protein